MLIDIKNYYESIDINILFNQIDNLIEDKELNYLIKDFVQSYKTGLSLGSEMNQIFAIHYLNQVDHFIKEKLKCKYYGRYMDDSYIICKTKEEALFYLQQIEQEYEKLHLTINKKKTKICKLKHFKWLQNRITVYGKDNIKIKPRIGFFAKERHKIKSFKKFYFEKKMNVYDIIQSYQSWRGNSNGRTCNQQYKQMDKFFIETMFPVFNIEFPDCFYDIKDGKFILIKK